jgi:hypothetical protein
MASSLLALLDLGDCSQRIGMPATDTAALLRNHRRQAGQLQPSHKSLTP